MIASEKHFFRFRIDYATRWGQQLAVCGDLSALGNWQTEGAVRMFCMAPGRWDLCLELPREAIRSGFQYKYVLLEADGDILWEGGPARSFPAGERYQYRRGLELRDAWQAPGAPEVPLNSAVFTQVLFKRPTTGPALGAGSTSRPRQGSRSIHFRISASCVEPHHRLCLIGGPNSLGAWREDRARVLSDNGSPWWSLDTELPTDLMGFDYKYGLWDSQADRFVAWEAGPNRHLELEPQGDVCDTLIRTEAAFRYPRGLRRGAGVAVPVFSLRSRDGLGVGEFLDLKLLVDWARLTGLEMIQLLPINDTSMTATRSDSYPYRAISVFALHPIYLRVSALSQALPDEIQARLASQTEAFNAQLDVNYEAVIDLKRQLIGDIFRRERERFLNDPAFRRFFDENAYWLKPYAAFCLLRDRFGTADWRTWPDDAQSPGAQIEALTDEGGPDAVALTEIYFTQYHLHRQLAEAVAYARERGVALKGDIPIGVSPSSVDTWQAPELFNLDRQAGAPPDDFSENGQNWSMPTYNWPRMAAGGYQWWRARIRQMGKYFDAVRIDHILGFFRIWEIPTDMLQGLMGRFNPALPLSGSALAARGIHIPRDAARFCRPFLRHSLLEALFGELAGAIIAAYCVQTAPGTYTLKPEADTQHKLLRLPLPEAILNRGPAVEVATRRDLMRLCGEVLLLPDPDRPDHYHPRINLHKTDSFMALDDGTRERLWQVYVDFFYQRHDYFWKTQGLKRLPALCDATGMLICGEDLGMVPDSVPAVMDQLGILSLKVQRMPTRRDTDFNHPADYPYASVCTTATHDMAPLREWWQSCWDRERHRIQGFYQHFIGWEGEAPQEASPELCAAIIWQHLCAPSMWAIFPIQDLLAMDGQLRHPDPYAERINTPSDPDHYWRYRLHRPLEALLAADDFNRRVADMVARSGRGRGTSSPH